MPSCIQPAPHPAHAHQFLHPCHADQFCVPLLLCHCCSWREILADASLDLGKPLSEELQWRGFSEQPPPPPAAGASRIQVLAEEEMASDT